MTVPNAEGLVSVLREQSGQLAGRWRRRRRCLRVRPIRNPERTRSGASLVETSFDRRSADGGSHLHATVGVNLEQNQNPHGRTLANEPLG